MRDLARRTAVAVLGASHIVVPVGRALLPRRPTLVDDEMRVSRLADRSGNGEIAVLAHWDQQSVFSEAAELTLDGLISAGIDVVVVSTSADHAQLADQLRDRALAVVTRRNLGYDFLSWARGIELLRGEELLVDRVILTNTSMYGPLRPLRPVLDRLWALPSPVLGMTESREFGPHLQSWFLAFGPPVSRSGAFDAYWQHIRPATNKWGTILAHEQNWARALTPRGSQPGALLPADRTSRSRNPLTVAWDRVLELGVPFVKRSLFLANPDRIDLSGWRDVVGLHAPGFDVGVIERDVRRLTGREAP